MRSKINIVFLTPGFAASGSDSTCIPPLLALIKELYTNHSVRYNFQVVAYQYPFTKGNYLWNNIPVFAAGGNNKKFPAKWQTWVTVINFLKKFHKKNPVHIIHSFWLTECALTGNWISRITGAKHVMHVMGQDVLPSNKYFKYLRIKDQEIIANSLFAATQLEKNHKIKSQHIIPFGINENDFVNIDFTGERNIDLLGVGSLTGLKNLILFVRIFSILKKEFPSITGQIVGEGPEHNHLKKLISDEGLTDTLILTGKLGRDVVLKKMSQSKILLHTSTFESAGYVFPEALRCGMKVVCFETGFLPEVMGAYACKDEMEMQKTLRSLLSYKQNFQCSTVPLISETAEAISGVYKKLIKAE